MKFWGFVLIMINKFLFVRVCETSELCPFNVSARRKWEHKEEVVTDCGVDNLKEITFASFIGDDIVTEGTCSTPSFDKDKTFCVFLYAMNWKRGLRLSFLASEEKESSCVDAILKKREIVKAISDIF